MEHLVPYRLGWRKADDQVAHITLAMRPYYERRREKARLYARDPLVRERAKARRAERYAHYPEYRQRALECASRVSTVQGMHMQRAIKILV